MASDAERLAQLEGHAIKTERALGEVAAGVSSLADTVRGQGRTLDEVKQALVAQQAVPRFDPKATLGVVRDVILVLIAILVPAAGALIWTITVVTSANDQLQSAEIRHNRELYESRLRGIEEEMGWRARTESTAAARP